MAVERNLAHLLAVLLALEVLAALLWLPLSAGSSAAALLALLQVPMFCQMTNSTPTAAHNKAEVAVKHPSFAVCNISFDNDTHRRGYCTRL